MDFVVVCLFQDHCCDDMTPSLKGVAGASTEVEKRKMTFII